MCSEGLRVRAIIGDADSEHVRYRDREEGTPLTLAVRIQTTLNAWAPLLDCSGFELRYQDIPLYNSVFRLDEEMLVTPHLFATLGSRRPCCTCAGSARAACSPASRTTSIASGQAADRTRMPRSPTCRRRWQARVGRTDYYDDPDAPLANSLVPPSVRLS
jgi:hypothetical protein